MDSVAEVRVLRRFLNEDEGANALEYAVIAAGLVVVMAGALSGVGAVLRSTFMAWSASM